MKNIKILLLLTLFALLLWLPQLAYGLLILNLLIMVMVGFSRWYAVSLPPISPPKCLDQHQPFVSIQIPTYNEPPELVIATLRALAKLNYSNYEVILFDNNTPDPAVYLPVQRECERLGTKFRFFHQDGVKGFKAGAMNICNGLMNPATEFILVVDADYRVEPNIIRTALKYSTDPQVGLVQFPQAYLNVSAANQPLRHEYEHFFSVYMNLANHLNCVLATGTVSFIRRTALKAAGGWAGASITEDVELGLNMHRAGYRGIYVPAELGKGLMPTDLASLQVQRARWVYGNMQTLLTTLRRPLHFNFRQYFGTFTLLTAWFNFYLLPILILVGAVVISSVSTNFYLSNIIHLALWSVFAQTIFLFGLFIFAAFSRREGCCRTASKAFLVHLGLSYEGAYNWLKVLIEPGMEFKRTNKFFGNISNQLLDSFQGQQWTILLTVAALGLSVNYPIYAGLTLSFALLFGLANWYVRQQLRVTHAESGQYYQLSNAAEVAIEKELCSHKLPV